MNISTYFNRRFDSKQHGFSHKDIFDNFDEPNDLIFFEVDQFSRFWISDSQQRLNDLIDIDLDLVIHRLCYFAWDKTNY